MEITWIKQTIDNTTSTHPSLRAYEEVFVLIKMTYHGVKLIWKLNYEQLLWELYNTKQYSLYIKSNEKIDQDKLENLINQLSKSFIPLKDFNSHNTIWGFKETIRKGRGAGKFITKKEQCLLNQKTLAHLYPANGKVSAIDLTICDPTICLDLTWCMHIDTCDSYHFLISKYLPK